jgi:hypothetical protein
MTEDVTKDFMHALAMEAMVVPLDGQVMAYFATPTALDVMPSTKVAQGGINMNLSNLCPIPSASWVPYFMDFKAPFKALKMEKLLIATLDTVEQRTRVAPLLDWLRAGCMRLGPNANDR